MAGTDGMHMHSWRAGVRVFVFAAIGSVGFAACGSGDGDTGGDGGSPADDAATEANDAAPAASDSSAGPSGSKDASTADSAVILPSGPRPFYVFGHNPNTLALVTQDIADGANALEPDVNVYSNAQGTLCVSHGEGAASDPTLIDFLTQLHTIAVANPALSLIVFDCKPKTATAAHGTEILNAIRENLTFDTQLNVIISVGSLADTAIFDDIKTMLGPREGVMIDAENDPVAVSSYFTGIGIQNQSFGNGISVLNDVLGPNVRPSLERVCELRAESALPKFIYAWTVNDVALMREYIRIGVDGLISDDIAQLKGVTAEPEFKNAIRLATRADNPMTPPNAGYGLVIHTGNVSMAGTDAFLTFTLTGTLGSSSMVVNTELVGREESGDVNYITLQSVDLGPLLSVTVQRDNYGNGPDWFLDYITVTSARYGGPTKQASFNDWIETTPYSVPLK
jgi:hypothetical protein